MAVSDDQIRNFLRKNVLFDGFSEHQLEQIVALSEIVTVSKDQYIIQENDMTNDIYIIKEGALVVEKFDQENNRYLQLATLGPGAIVGELAILDNAPRSASVRATQDTTVIIIYISKLRVLYDEATNNRIISRLSELAAEAKLLIGKTSLYPALIHNLAKGLGKRLRSTNDAVIEGLRRELQHATARIVMGQLIISVIAILSIYIVVLKLIEGLHYKYFNSTIISAPLIAFFGIIVYWEIAKTSYPLRFYGLTFKGWRPAIKESLLVTVFMLLLMVAFKWILINTTPYYANSPIFEMQIFNSIVPFWQIMLSMIVYILLVPIQELIVRGALQSSFQELLISKHKYILAILLSNLLFSITHFHISLAVGLSVFLPGLFWGWLYSRHRTLVGVSISHQIFGIWALLFVGL